jgi:hypothetical protein
MTDLFVIVIVTAMLVVPVLGIGMLCCAGDAKDL